MPRVVHLLSGLEIGGKERVALDLARRGRAAGTEHSLLLFDTGFRGTSVDLDPEEVPWTFVPRSPGLDLRFARSVARRVSEQHVDVLHAHNETAIVYAALAALFSRRRRPRIVGTFHTWPTHETKAARLACRWACRRVWNIVAVADSLAEALRTAGWTDRCGTIWNGIDTREFAPCGPLLGIRRRLDIPDDTFLVGHVGRMDPVKRHEDLLRAVQLLRDGSESVHFVLVGDGPRRDHVARLASGCPGVTLLPRVDDVAAFMREIDALVLCSDEEAAPRVVLEAMACATPVVATEVGGIPAMLRGDVGPCGVLVPRRRPDELARAVRDLSVDEARRISLGAAARRRAMDFSEETEWAEYAALYGSEGRE